MATPKIRTLITPEAAREHSIPLLQAEKDVRNRVAGEGRTLFDAAIVLYQAVDQGIVGTKKGQTKQGEYVAERLGYQSGSTGTLLKNLARAVVVHGVQHGSDEWTFLQQNRGKGAAVTTLLARDADPEVGLTLHKWATGATEVPKSERKARPNDGVEAAKADAPVSSPATKSATISDVVDLVLASLQTMPEAEFLRLYDAVVEAGDSRHVGVPVEADVA